MDTSDEVVTISAAEWNERQARGMTAVVSDQRYIVTTHAVTREPVYQSVAIRG
jgi:hypothetical protein